MSNCTVIAIDFASRYCVNRRNSANTHPNVKTDTRLVVIPIHCVIYIASYASSLVDVKEILQSVKSSQYLLTCI